jgi:hypothetical protein
MKDRVIGGAHGSSPSRGAFESFSHHLIGQVEKAIDHRNRRHGSLQVHVDHFLVRKFAVEKDETLLAPADQFGSNVVSGIEQSVR